MIAPRKKKLIKLIIMAWSVVLVITGLALPVFASVATDDSGNWSPSRYYITWYIYDSDTDEYNTVNVTSSVTVDGLTFTFPYNSTGVSRVQMFLYTDLSSNVYIDGISFDGYLTYQSSTLSGLLDLSSSSIYSRYYYSGEDLLHVNTSLGTDNPFSFVESYDTLVPLNRCRLTFYPSAAVSGYLTITFNSFILGGEDIKDQIYISQLEDSTEDLDSGVEALATALPLPTFDADVYASAEAIADDYSFFNDGLRFTFMESDLVTHIFILVVYFTCLSIAIFGHAGG